MSNRRGLMTRMAPPRTRAHTWLEDRLRTASNRGALFDYAFRLAQLLDREQLEQAFKVEMYEAGYFQERLL